MAIWQRRVDPQEMADWIEAEVEYYLLGPFDGEIPGLVRRIRRILDVSQRGLAAMLGVSQSQVARWETSRTSPRAATVVEMLQLARLRISLHRQETDERESGTQATREQEVRREVEPMRDDGARDRAGRRYPAHVDLEVVGWWAPRDALMTGQDARWREWSRRWETPGVRYHHRAWKSVLRDVFGTPVDHPARHQLVAEAHHLDDKRDERRDEMRVRHVKRSA